MNRIKQIKLKHFKFFYGEVTIDLERQNALIFGENGSGKSSLYWALYTFLQSVFKDTPQNVQKYFQHNHDENLRNRFAPDDDDSYIKIVLEDDHKSITEKQISNSTVNTKTGTLIRQAVQGSELINYKLLSKIHDFKNLQQIDLFPIMDKEILPFINFRENLVRHDGVAGTANAQEWWDYIKPGMQPRGKIYKTFAAAVTKFNSELQFYFDSIVESVNEYLQKFKQPFTISFDIKNCTYDAFEEGSKRNHKTIAPNVFIHAHFNHAHIPAHKQKITRPHTFLNEAKLTAIALSIRLAMIGQKLSGVVAADTPKFLILDDVLISLDMSNREIVLDIILQEFTDYQQIILTHDRNFFELLRHRIKKFNQPNWKYIEMYEYEENGIPKPSMFESESYIGQAKNFIKKGKYEIAGNLLRKEAENIMKSFLPDKFRLGEYGQVKPLAILLDEAVKFSKQNDLNFQLFEELRGHVKFILNCSSHDSYDVPLYKHELLNCLSVIEQIKEIKNEPFLKRGEQVEFELKTADGMDTYKFEIQLEDDFRLLKEPGKDSVISKGMVNYWVYKNGVKTTASIQHKQDTLIKMYKACFDSSDKTKNADFWEEIIITSTGQLLKTERKF